MATYVIDGMGNFVLENATRRATQVVYVLNDSSVHVTDGTVGAIKHICGEVLSVVSQLPLAEYITAVL